MVGAAAFDVILPSLRDETPRIGRKHVAMMKPHKRTLKTEILAYKRQSILEACSHLFYQNGYEGTTLDAVADRLAVTKPFLYSYYRSKSEILAAICETGIRESLDALEGALSAGGTTAEQLRRLVGDVARIVMTRQEYVMVYQREMKNLDRVDAQRILRMRHDFDVRVAQLLQAGTTDGSFNLDDPAIASVWIGGLVTWIANWYVPGGRRSPDDVVAEIVKVALRIVGLK